MPLDARGDLSIGEIAFYIVVLPIILPLALRYGFKRKAGWVNLLVLSVGEKRLSSMLQSQN